MAMKQGKKVSVLLSAVNHRGHVGCRGLASVFLLDCISIKPQEEQKLLS